MPAHIRIYRYLEAKYAISAIEKRELHVSRLKELNDPFEFMPGLRHVHPTWPPEIVDQHLDFLVEKFHPLWGIISFSEKIHDPVVWSHYSDSHRGIAIGFDYALNDSLLQMTYPTGRPTIDVYAVPGMSESELKRMLLQILSAKAPSWIYEQEHRVIVELSKCREHEGRYFEKIPEDFMKHVVLGIRCTVTEQRIRDALQKSGLQDVQITRARRCPTEFRVLV
jgi:hypothetical protein